MAQLWKPGEFHGENAGAARAHHGPTASWERGGERHLCTTQPQDAYGFYRLPTMRAADALFEGVHRTAPQLGRAGFGIGQLEHVLCHGALALGAPV